MVHFYHFKFKSQKEAQRISWDSPFIDVWNLKREIIQAARLGEGLDFDLKIYDEGTNKGMFNSWKDVVVANGETELDDDLEMIPKDSTVLAQRLPAAAPGKGRAARYVSGKPPVSSKTSAAAAAIQNNRVMDMAKAQTEEERLKAMFSLGQVQWQQKQEEMSHEARVPFSGAKNMKRNVPEGEPPHGYVCYRCGKKGHWIQACPTNDDANYDNRNRIKRTTGIPRSMLKKIDPEDVDKLDDEQRQKLMVNAEGEYVFAQADEKEWRKHLERVKATEKAQQEAKQGNKGLQDRGLECPIDKRMFVDPMKTPCCGKTYCHDCIENALIDNDLTCPGCQTENISLERLEPDEDVKASIKAYEAEKIEVKRRSKSPASSAAAATPTADGVQPPSRDGSKSPGGGGRKRKADEDAEEAKSDTLSSAAPDMKRQKSDNPSETAGKDEADGKADALAADATIPNMMPPDMATMMANMQNMPFPNMNMMNMGMPGMMPFMGMPAMPMMPGFNMNMMNGAATGAGFPNMNTNMNMNMMNNNNNMNGGGAVHTRHPTHTQQPFPPRGARGGRGGGGGGGGGFRGNHHAAQANSVSPMTGVPGVPTGPKGKTGAPPTAPAGHAGGAAAGVNAGMAAKFPNQQRHGGREEESAYARQPVGGRGRGVAAGLGREADYRELGPSAGNGNGEGEGDGKNEGAAAAAGGGDGGDGGGGGATGEEA